MDMTANLGRTAMARQRLPARLTLFRLVPYIRQRPDAYVLRKGRAEQSMVIVCRFTEMVARACAGDTVRGQTVQALRSTAAE
jgi:hypothetical protein